MWGNYLWDKEEQMREVFQCKNEAFLRVRPFLKKKVNYNIWGYLQVVNPFLPSFTFDVDTAKGELRKNSGLTHRYLWLAYKQYNNERVR